MRCLLLICSLLLAIGQFGCITDSSARRWPYPEVAAPRPFLVASNEIESAYTQAVRLHKRSDPRCVEAYHLCLQLTENEKSLAPAQNSRIKKIHDSALVNLLQTAQDHDRYHPGLGILLCDNSNTYLPIAPIGFDWRSEDFSSLHPVGSYRNPRLPVQFQAPGTGHPVVVQRDAQDLNSVYGDQLTFAATAVYQAASNHQTARIELYNPLRFHCTIDNQPLAKDLTAPYAYTIRDRDRIALLNFIYPQRTAARPHLFMTEPYQRGKIPLVFVHGLASDHTTWVELANHLNANPEFRSKYQVWYFQYPTGIPFLASAAAMRLQLEQLCVQLDPAFEDPALHQIVLMGHSMGGLIAKLQVTTSDQEIWTNVCKVPICELNASPSIKSQLERWFSFSPSARIKRVVLVATPHRGSPLATKPIGKISAKLVREPEDMENKWKLLVQNNPGAFYNELSQGYPTSIDLLEPDDRVLKGIRNLPYRDHVCIDSVIGAGHWMLGYGPSDTVVPVTSAIELVSTSEQYIHSTHTKILGTMELQHWTEQLLLSQPYPSKVLPHEGQGP